MVSCGQRLPYDIIFYKEIYMEIEVKQIKNVKKNEFEVFYDRKLKYKAKLPFVSIKEPLDLEKIRKINLYDTLDNLVYSTDYNYIENFKEELIPMKFLLTGSQKFNQLTFTSNKKEVYIYYEEKEIWNNRYVIEIEKKLYYCYSIEDGYIRHLPIYDGDTQVGEVLKSNVIKDGLDEYCCYLKDEYTFLNDAIVCLLLYLDRSEYSSSYLSNKSYELNKNYSYNKTNKFYNKNWVKDNFNDEFFKKVDNEVKSIKKKMNTDINKMKNIFIIAFIFIIIFTISILILINILK